MQHRTVLRVLAVFFFFGLCTYAQLNGRLTGTVVDPSGAPVPGAAVNVSLPNGTTAILSTTTSSDGLFAFSAVRPDTYDVSVEAPGFSKFVARVVKVNPSTETTIPNVVLEVQSTQQTVEITATAQAVQTTTSEIATTVTQRQIQSLPVLDRQVTSLFLTQPGVSSGRGPTVVNGLRTSFANVTLDGVNIQDNFIRTNALDYIPNKTTIEQVAEFTVATTNVNSTVGNGVAQMTLATPSGSNTYHGSLYWYNRNNHFAANDWFSNRDRLKRPFLNQNQPGGSLGGRIIRDKLFFYTNYEAFRNRQQTPVTRTVLTDSARQGIFRYKDPAGTLHTANLLQMRGVQINPYIAALLKDLPATMNNSDVGDQLNTGGYSLNARNNEDRNVALGKLDYYLSTRHSFSGTYSYNTDLVDRPVITGFTQTFSTTVPPVYNDNHSHMVAGSWRWTLSPSLTNEFRGGFNLSPGTFSLRQGSPQMILSGLAFDNPINPYMPQGRATDTYNLQDNMSWVKGKHTMYFGYQSQYIRTVPFNDAGIAPTYSIGIAASNTTGLQQSELPGITGQDLNTANALYTSLAGIVSGYSQTFNVKDRTSGFVNGFTNVRHFKYDSYSGYIQDNYRVLPRLTLNVGLRYDYFAPLDEKDSLYLLPRLEDGNFIKTLMDPNGVLDFAGGSVGRPFYNPDRNNFAPNFGFAYDVFGDGKTAVRGGYSVSYVNDELITVVRNNIGTNAGLSSTVTNANASGNLTESLPVIKTPTFKVPLTLLDNYAVSTQSASGLPDPNLRTPYVQQFNLGVQHEVKGAIVELRYVGNHGVKELRAFDYNQVMINENGFLDDFRRARANGFAAMAAGKPFSPAYNAAIPGSQQLSVISKLALAGNLANSSIVSLIRQGEVGSLAEYYAIRGYNADTNVQFFPNPNILGANTVANYSNSTYNSLQFDVRRRTGGWAQWQFNYTLSKALGDASGDGQTRLEPFLDLKNPKIERAPEPFDIRHVFKANYVVELPFGKGRHFELGNKFINQVVGGWKTGGILTWYSGTPFSILSSRGTLNRSGSRSTWNTATSAVGGEDLNSKVGFFMTGNGPMFVDPSVKNPNNGGRAVCPDGTAPFNGEIFFNPDPGTIGALQRRSFYGPPSLGFDASLVKTFNLTERQTLEFRAEAFNLPNHPSFYPGNETNGTTVFNINSPTFGKITSTFYAPRVMQFGLYYRF